MLNKQLIRNADDWVRYYDPTALESYGMHYNEETHQYDQSDLIHPHSFPCLLIWDYEYTKYAMIPNYNVIYLSDFEEKVCENQ